MMRNPVDVDLDDTTGCPHTGRCAGCGTVEDVTTATAETPVGVFCVRLCDTCLDRPVPAPNGWLDAYEVVGAHCEHLGITLDDMAGLLLDENRSRAGGYR